MQRTLSALALLLGCLGGCGGATVEPRQSADGKPPPRSTFDINGIIGTGQSLSVGAEAANVSAAAEQQPYNNLKLSLGGATVPPFDPGAASLTLVPLTEPIRPKATTYPSAYPANLYGESPHAAMAAQITKLARAAGLPDYVSAHSVVGESGQGMNVIDKTASEMVDGAKSTGRAYAASLFEAKAIARLSDAQSKSYGVGAVVLTHGETDSGNASYGAALRTLWTDYNGDLKAITGQTQSIPLFVSQTHAFGTTAGSGPSLSMIALWQVGVDHPGEIVCTGPKYQYPYAADNIHLVTRGYELYGEKLGEIYFQKVVLGRDWQPLQPTAVEKAGNVVTVRFHVPEPPLAWDEAIAAPFQAVNSPRPERAQGRGFELESGGDPIAIELVTIVDDSVRITARSEVPAGARVGYALTSDGGTPAGGVSVRRGQLKDSDATVGAFTGQAQANYAVAFQLPVP